MKKFLLLAAVSTVMFSSQAMAATETGQGQAKATIVEELSVAQSSGGELNFGRMLGKGNKVRIEASNADKREADNEEYLVAGGGEQSGKWKVTGPANTSFNLSIDPSVTLASNGNSMTATLQLSTNSDKIGTNGEYDFYVGGELTVTEGQAAGEYSKEYTVTLSY